MRKKSETRRRRYWIDPGFQKRFLFMLLTIEIITLGVGALMPTFLAFLFIYPVTESASDVTKILGAFTIVAFFASASLAYLSIRISHTICGPAYRLQVALKQLKNGEKPEKIVLRKGDELRELVDLFNETVEAIHGDSYGAPAMVRAMEEGERPESSETTQPIPLADNS